MAVVLIVKPNLKMPTPINKSNLSSLGGAENPIENLAKSVDKTDNTLNSVERIAGKVENILGLLNKFKDKQAEKENSQTSYQGNAMKIEKQVNEQTTNTKENIKSKARLNINVESAEKKIDEFLKAVDDKKTIKEVKKELEEMKKSGMWHKIIQGFINDVVGVKFE